MSIRVYVSRVSMPYWEAIPQDEREAIYDAIPDGHRLHIFPGYRDKPGTADIQLRTLDNQSAGPVVRGYVTAQRCWSVLPRTVVTTDGAGYITSIEDE